MNGSPPSTSSALVASSSVALQGPGSVLVLGAIAGGGMLVAAAGVGGLAFGEKKTWPAVLTAIGVAVALAATVLGDSALAASVTPGRS